MDVSNLIISFCFPIQIRTMGKKALSVISIIPPTYPSEIRKICGLIRTIKRGSANTRRHNPALDRPSLLTLKQSAKKSTIEYAIPNRDDMTANSVKNIISKLISASKTRKEKTS